MSNKEKDMSPARIGTTVPKYIKDLLEDAHFRTRDTRSDLLSRAIEAMYGNNEDEEQKK